MADSVFTTGNANVQAFNAATQHARSRGDAAEAERAATETARLALPAQVTALTAPGIKAAQDAAALATQRAGILGSVATDAELTGKPAGDYRQGREIVSWSGSAVTRRTPALASVAEVDAVNTRIGAAEASLKRISVDATLYGVAEGAPAQTLMAAIAATPDGGTLVCPKVKLRQTPTCSLWIIDRPTCHVTVYGNGLTIEADPSMSDNTGAVWPECRYKGGFVFLNVQDLDIHGIKYDGRLDARTPIGGDGSGVGGPRCGWQFADAAHRIRLYDCEGSRTMMDGFLTGPMEEQRLPPGFPRFTLDRMPADNELHNCTALYNYRQGISPCGSVNLLINGGEWAYTGQLGDGKWTSPAAGMCWEAYLPLDWRNTGGRITGCPKIHHNRGAGLSIENATQGLRMDSGHLYENGVGISVSSTGTLDNVITGTLVERNRLEDVSIAGFRNHFFGNTVRSLRGVRSIYGGLPGGGRNISDNTVIALEPQAGVNGGHVMIFGGGICYIDLKTGRGLGYDAQGQPVGYTVTHPGDTVSDNVLTDALSDYGGALYVESRGAHVLRNRLTGSVSDPARKTGVSVYHPEGVVRDNDVRGYAVPVSGGGAQPALPATPVTVAYLGRTLNGYTPANMGQQAALLATDDGTLTYRVTWAAIWDTGPAIIALFDLFPAAGYSLTVRRVQAFNSGNGTFGTVAIKPDQQQIVLTAVPELAQDTLYVMEYMADVELRRV